MVLCDEEGADWAEVPGELAEEKKITQERLDPSARGGLCGNVRGTDENYLADELLLIFLLITRS